MGAIDTEEDEDTTRAGLTGWVAHDDRLQVQAWPPAPTPHPEYPTAWYERQELDGRWVWLQMWGRNREPVTADAAATLNRLVKADETLAAIAWRYGIGLRPPTGNATRVYTNVHFENDLTYTAWLTPNDDETAWQLTLAEQDR